MKKTFTRPIIHLSLAAATVGGLLAWSGQHTRTEASSHREAPLIADDPLADNTDLYAFRDPTNSELINIIANYIPFELPQGGPNYNTFGENVRYEIHVKNDATTTGDDITYRFTFTRTNEDGSTFFNIRLGKQNLKTTYKLEMIKGGATTTLVAAGPVPPPNIGPRSIEGAAGLGTPYGTLMSGAIQTLPDGTKVFCGPADDPFFVDLGGIFDLGGVRPTSARDGVAKKNVHSIALQIPISVLQKTGKTGAVAANILDPDYVIGVWASASRPAMKTITSDGAAPTYSGNWIQVSRLGMPLTNEVIQPIGTKDRWNALTPYNEDRSYDSYFSNPELGLYMAEGTVNGNTYYGAAVPGLADLRIQANSLGAYDFRNGANGLSALKGNPAVAGTAFETYGDILLQPGKPRSVDLLPIFQTGVPNARPYQLATGKAGNPLAAGKPFINNFLPTLGDMLRLNMAVPATPRNSADFSSEGLLAAAVLGLTDPRFNGDATLQAIPNMDGFPNGRRLEDDVTRIELQAVSGVVLAAIGLWYDDYTAGGSPVTAQLGKVLNFKTGVEANDTTFKTTFPYVQTPWRGTKASSTVLGQRSAAGLGLQPEALSGAQNYPNPFTDQTTFHYEVNVKTPLTLTVTDMLGRKVATVFTDKSHKPGTYEYTWRAGKLDAGIYVATLSSGATVLQSMKIIHKN